MDSGFQVLDSGFAVIGTSIPDSNAQDSRFYQCKFVRIPDSTSKTFTVFGFPYRGRSVRGFRRVRGFQNPFYTQNRETFPGQQHPPLKFEIIKIRNRTSSGKNNQWFGVQFSLNL